MDLYYNPRNDAVQYNSNGDRLYLGADGDYECNYGVSENIWDCYFTQEDIPGYEVEIDDSFEDDNIYIEFSDEDGIEIVIIIYSNDDVFTFYMSWEKDMSYVFAEN